MFMDTKKLRQKILDLAIRGKLVPQDPNDEPASVLLERILAEKERLIKEGKIKRSKKTATNDDIEAPFEIPESWEWTNIEAVAESNIGLTYKPSDITLNGIPVYRSNNIQNKEIVLTDIVRVKTDIQTKQYLNEGDLLICARNGSRNLVGKCALIKHLTEPTSFGAFMAVCRSEFNEWIFLLLNSEYFNTYLDESNSTAINQVTQKMLLAFQLPFPPKKEQKRIYNEVTKWFSVIDELESNEGDLLKAIDKAKSKILDLAIHGKLVPQDPNDEPAIELLKRINPKFEPCDNELDDTHLPDNWCWTTLGNIFNHNTGKALNKSDSQEGSLLPYITTSNVYWNRFDLSEIKKMFFKDSEIDKCTITKGDLLVCEGGDIGRSAIWNYDYDICIQNHIHRLRAKGDVSHLLYLYVLMFYKWTDRIRGNGIGLQGLSSRLLDKIIVPLPPYQEQLRIVSKIEELFAALNSIKESLE